jgi:hypothetical protein
MAIWGSAGGNGLAAVVGTGVEVRQGIPEASKDFSSSSSTSWNKTVFLADPELFLDHGHQWFVDTKMSGQFPQGCRGMFIEVSRLLLFIYTTLLSVVPFHSVCVRVCVKERDREGERDRKREIERKSIHPVIKEPVPEYGSNQPCPVMLCTLGQCHERSLGLSSLIFKKGPNPLGGYQYSHTLSLYLSIYI